MTKTLSVAAIKNGTSIDHIPAGQAIRIMHLLKLLGSKHKVTMGINLPSKRLVLKDLIKIENHIINTQEANEITIFAPHATINIIKDFEVVDKITTSLPSSIANIFICPNPNCVTSNDMTSSFMIREQGKQVVLTCRYCEKIFDRNEVKVRI